ncbi:hypothetical protein [Pantoea stewartii]|uniref:hypothetical protein n=1 Tax=Pantoea stewartii TaxID=66269 RepID=UPI00345C3C95
MLSRTIHTLGPAGTNCEKAGYLWLKNNNFNGEVILYSTLEEALVEVKKKQARSSFGLCSLP